MDLIDSLFDASKCEENRELALQNGDFWKLVDFFSSSHELDSPLEVEQQIKLNRTLRNFCCGDVLVAQGYIERGVIVKGVESCRSLCFDKVSDEEDNNEFQAEFSEEKDINKSNNERNSVVLSYCQLISNFSASGEQCAQYLFDCTESLTLFRDLLAVTTVCRDNKITAAALGIVYNCIQTDTENGHMRLNQFCKHRQLLCQWLLAATNNSDKDAANTDAVMEWFQLIGFLLIKRNKMFTVFQCVASESEGSSSAAVVNHEQLISLHLALSVFEDTYCSRDILSTYESKPSGIDGFVIALANMLCRLDQVSLMDFSGIYSTSGGNDGGITEGNDSNDTNSSINNNASSINNHSISIDHINNDVDCADEAINQIDAAVHNTICKDFATLAMQFIGTALSVLSESKSTQNVSSLKQVITHNTQLIQFCSDLIKDHHVSARVQRGCNYNFNTQDTNNKHYSGFDKLGNNSRNTNTDSNSNKNGSNTHSDADLGQASRDREETVKQIVKSTLQLLGNIVYNCSEAQDLLRECGGLAVVLSHCGTDFLNPLAREWALFTTRNACANNRSNQAFIESLKPQNVSVQDEEMKSKGVEVEVNMDTGKFKFVQKQKERPSADVVEAVASVDGSTVGEAMGDVVEVNHKGAAKKEEEE